MSGRVLALVANLAAATVALALVWEAELKAHWVWPATVEDAALARAKAEPAPQVLQLISQQRLGLPASYEDKPALVASEALRKADLLLSGTFETHRRGPVPYVTPFQRANFGSGHYSQQLFIAGMVPLEILLNAYRMSGQERYLRAAIDEMRAFDRVDRLSLVPKAFQWNDHAMANTISILAELWSLMRQRPDLDPDAAKALLGLVSRTAERLAKPEFFTFRTNHGIMQSVALVQVAVAFPSLAGARRFGELGCTRLHEQVPYYLSDEGAVLEHSAGYHEFGRELMGFAIQLSDVSGCRAPQSWRDKLDAARRFSALMWRPDRSATVFGNTDFTDRLPLDETTVPSRPPREISFLPVSGYAVWWSGLQDWPSADRLSQTVVAWANWSTRAHKHADDQSVLVWSHGIPWITTVGYWPYDADGYAAAQGWDSANAAHFTDEPARDIPRSTVRAVGGSDRLRAIALQRRDAAGTAALTREVVALDGSTWLVADRVSGARKGEVRRSWTSSSKLDAQQIAPAAVLLDDPGTGMAARIDVIGDLARPLEIFKGSRDPYLGWNVRAGTPTPAPAIRASQNAPESLLLTVVRVGTASALRARAAPVLGPTALQGSWEVTVDVGSGPALVSWAGDRVAVRLAGGDRIELPLAGSDPAWADEQGRIDRLYRHMDERYERFRDLLPYRVKLTLVFGSLLLMQELACRLLRRRVPRAVVPLRVSATIGWLLLGLYTAFVYLA